MWEEMGLVRVYTKLQGQQPDFTNPVVLSADRGGCSVEDFCAHIHRSLVKDVKYVLVWGAQGTIRSIVTSATLFRTRTLYRWKRKMEGGGDSSRIRLLLLEHQTERRLL